MYEYVLAQAKHETDNFKSTVFLSRKNLFGMNVSHKRKEYHNNDDESGYASYSSYINSVRDLLAWMNYTSFPYVVGGVADYVHELKKRYYFTDSEKNYLNGVDYYYKHPAV